MPKYVYKCPDCETEADIVHPVGDEAFVFCPTGDGVLMKRKFVMPMVNWNGLKPSQGEIHPKIKQQLRDGERRRKERTGE